MYVIQYHQQLERTREMVTLRKNDKTLEVFYHDPKTGELWKSFFPKRTANGCGPKLLRPEPLPESLEIQLELCLNSNVNADAIGLAIEYSSKPEAWDEILSLLEQNRKKYLRTNFLAFIDNLGILTPIHTLNDAEINLTSIPISNDALLTLKKRARRLKMKRFFWL